MAANQSVGAGAMSNLIISPRTATLTIQPTSGPALVLQATTQPQIVLAAVGVQGPIGPQGEGVQADPGDFTLLFENQLI